MGDALASSKQSGKSTGLLLAVAPRLTHFVTRVMLIRLIHWPRRGKSAGTNQMRQWGVSFGQHSSYQVAAPPGFYFGIKPGLVVAQLSCLWLALASLALFEPKAVAVQFEDVDVVGQSVEQRTG